MLLLLVNFYLLLARATNRIGDDYKQKIVSAFVFTKSFDFDILGRRVITRFPFLKFNNTACDSKFRATEPLENLAAQRRECPLLSTAFQPPFSGVTVRDRKWAR